LIRGLLLSGGVAQVVAPPFVAPPEGALLWIDCDRDDTKTWIEPVEALTGTLVFENHLSDLENLTHRSFFDSTQDYEMVVFRGLAGRSTSEQASTAIFLPLTLITGIFGMNFEAIPGQHSPLGFWITMAAMVVIAVALLVFFRTRRYLSEKPRRHRQRKN